MDRSFSRSVAVVALVAAVVVVLRGRIELLTFARQWDVWLGEPAEGGVTLKEIVAARLQVAHLLPQMKDNMQVLAREDMELEQCRAEVARLRAQLNKQRDQILVQRADLDNQRGKVRKGTRRATPEEVKTDLVRQFQRFEVLEATLLAREEALAIREQALAKARAKLEAMLAAKRDLELQVQYLEARHQTLQARRSTIDVPGDNGRLTGCRTVVRGLRARLEADDFMDRETAKLEADTQHGAEIEALNDEAIDDVVRQIDQRFDSSPSGHAGPSGDRFK